jgi:hypothetical protein
MESFSAKILIIDINPYVGIPEDVLDALFEQAGKTKGPNLSGKKPKGISALIPLKD